MNCILIIESEGYNKDQRDVLRIPEKSIDKKLKRGPILSFEEGNFAPKGMVKELDRTTSCICIFNIFHLHVSIIPKLQGREESCNHACPDQVFCRI